MSVYARKDSPFWWASFSDHRGRRKNASLKLRVDSVPKARAKGTADALANACLVLRNAKTKRPDDVAVAVSVAQHYGVVSPDEAEALLVHGSVPANSGAPITIAQAMRAHPSHANDVDRRRRESAIAAFCKQSRVTLLEDVRVHHVTAWVASMRAQGFAYDTRRHALLGLRRACAMAPSYGLPNPIAGIRIDKREPTARPTLPTTEEVSEFFRGETDPRHVAACGLMAFAGLRVSEVVRAEFRDLDGDVLHVGARKAKNETSSRLIPLPAQVVEWIGAGSGPIIPHTRSWIGHNLRTPGDVPAKILRKWFATRAQNEWLWPEVVIQRWMGHAPSSVLGRHYAQEFPVKRLGEYKAKIESEIATLLLRES